MIELDGIGADQDFISFRAGSTGIRRGTGLNGMDPCVDLRVAGWIAPPSNWIQWDRVGSSGIELDCFSDCSGRIGFGRGEGGEGLDPVSFLWALIAVERIGSVDRRRSKLVGNGQNWSNSPNSPKFDKLVKLAKLIRNDQNWSKLVKIGQNWSKAKMGEID